MGAGADDIVDEERLQERELGRLRAGISAQPVVHHVQVIEDVAQHEERLRVLYLADGAGGGRRHPIRELDHRLARLQQLRQVL